MICFASIQKDCKALKIEIVKLLRNPSQFHKPFKSTTKNPILERERERERERESTGEKPGERRRRRRKKIQDRLKTFGAQRDHWQRQVGTCERQYGPGILPPHSLYRHCPFPSDLKINSIMIQVKITEFRSNITKQRERSKTKTTNLKEIIRVRET